MSTKMKAAPVAEETIDLTEAARQIADKAAARVTILQRARQEEEQHLAAVHAEIEQIARTAQARMVALADLRGTAQRSATVEHQAKDYALVAQGTLGEQEAITKWHQATSQAETARVALTNAERVAGEASTVEGARLSELYAEQEAGDLALIDNQEQMTSIEQVRTTAMADLGERELTRILASVDERQKRIEALRMELAEEQRALTGFLEDALPRLAPWSGLRRQVRERLNLDDETARVIAGALDYVDLLLKDGPRLTGPLATPATAIYMNWRQILCITADELFVYETLDGNPARLRERRARLASLLADYRAHLVRS